SLPLSRVHHNIYLIISVRYRPVAQYLTALCQEHTFLEHVYVKNWAQIRRSMDTSLFANVCGDKMVAT
ncbi:hypothetical protein, partial [Enterobacter asburiae]|uniref:hypothetical protein n=1 Tax=Enterobacter asburiae TaxID=61645 RepID=UPI001E489F08